MLAFKRARAFPLSFHSARSSSLRNMDTVCFRESAHFPPRSQPKSFSIDWILSSGHRKSALDSYTAYTRPKVLTRGDLFPAFTHRVFGYPFNSAYVYTPHFHTAAFRNTETRHHDGNHSVALTCSSAGDFGLKSCRRIRTVFSPEQLQKLEEVFAKQRYMTGSEKVLLASALQLTETQVKVWFQNRRTKWRKNRETEDRTRDQCSDFKDQTSMTEDGEFKSIDSDESPEM